jgi:RNA 2',3'-cyclic 3'-phosphodiesterase
MPRPNWFLALPVAGSFVLELPPLPPQFRRFHPEDVHLTLAFLGGCGEEAALRALAVLDERLHAAPLSSIPVSLAEVVPMGGSRRSYTALSALLDRGQSETRACLVQLRDVLLEAATGRREKRPPKPHVSIARPRGRATDAQREAGLTWAAELDLRQVSTTLDRIALYTWHQARHERLFRIVSERRLS